MQEYYVYLDDGCGGFDERKKAADQIDAFLSSNYGGRVSYVAEFVNHLHIEISDAIRTDDLEKLVKEGFGFVTGLEAVPQVKIPEDE